MGKAKWKMMTYNLNKQTNFFINNYKRTIDEETKWMIEFIVRNFKNFMMRNKSHYDCFIFTMSKIYFFNEGIRQDNIIYFSYRSFMDRSFIFELIILNAEVLRIELKKSLTDRRFRFPRCSHFEMKVEHSLCVLACYYLESTEKDYIRFLICDDCKDYIDFCVELWDEFQEKGGCNGRNFKEILGCKSVDPLNFSMY